MILKLEMKRLGLKLYKVYITDDPRLTLTYFTARSNRVTSPVLLNRENCYNAFLIEENLQQKTILTVLYC